MSLSSSSELLGEWWGDRVMTFSKSLIQSVPHKGAPPLGAVNARYNSYGVITGL